jgi:hypothetical protein
LEVKLLVILLNIAAQICNSSVTVSPVDVRANSILKSLTSVIGFIYVASAAIAVPRLPDYHVLLLILLCVAAMNKIAVLPLPSLEMTKVCPMSEDTELRVS